MYFNNLECCGVKELDNVSTSNDLEYDLYSAFINHDGDSHIGCGAVIFTQAGAKQTYGKRLAKLIEDKGLGTITVLPPFRNPNTGNPIVTFFWKLNQRAINKWFDGLQKIHEPYASYNEPDGR